MSNKSFFVRQDIQIESSREEIKKLMDFEVIHWGKNNTYPQWLNFLFNNSAIHSGIIRSKVHYTTSGGLNYEGEDELEWKKSFKNGSSDFDLNEVLEQCSLDLELYNGFYLKGFWSLDKKRVEKIEALDYEKVRKTSKEEVLYCDDWSDKNSEVKVYHPFDSINRDRREFYLLYEEKPKQVAKKNKIECGVYPAPPYSGGLTSILTDVKITNYQLNEISNGFSTGTIINLNNGAPQNDDDKRALEKDIKQNATGEDNAGGVLVLYNNGKDREATVVNISGNDLNDRYLSLSKDVRDNIVLAHSVTTPILFGVKQEGSLGNATELKIGYEIMNANYFQYRRRALISALSYILKQGNNLKGKISFGKVVLESIEQEVKEPNNSFKSKFSDDDVFEMFASCGVERSKKEIIFSRALPHEFDIVEQNELFLNEFQKDEFRKLRAVELQVLNLIKSGNDFNSIRKALKINPSKLSKMYTYFLSNELIDIKGGASLTTRGLRELGRQNATKISIFYDYGLAPNVQGDLIIPTTRDFCRKMVELSQTRIWNREDIDQISARLGYNVFTYRGGWYNNPDRGVNTPWCRHVWNQQLVYD